VNRTEFQVDVLPRLMDLADTFDRKPPSDAALRVWAETLGSLPVRPVLAALQGWSRSKTKFPAPAEIYAAANDADAEEREKRLAEDKARGGNLSRKALYAGFRNSDTELGQLILSMEAEKKKPPVQLDVGKVFQALKA
jgi:hypothetical protein